MTIIFRGVPIDDMILAVRAAKWFAEMVTPEAILAYGEPGSEKNFYAKRNKASITVRPDPIRRRA